MAEQAVQINNPDDANPLSAGTSSCLKDPKTDIVGNQKLVRTRTYVPIPIFRFSADVTPK